MGYFRYWLDWLMALIRKNQGIIIKHQNYMVCWFYVCKLCMSLAFIFHGKITVLFPQCSFYITNTIRVWMWIWIYSLWFTTFFFNKQKFQTKIQWSQLKNIQGSICSLYSIGSYKIAKLFNRKINLDTVTFCINCGFHRLQRHPKSGKNRFGCTIVLIFPGKGMENKIVIPIVSWKPRKDIIIKFKIKWIRLY